MSRRQVTIFVFLSLLTFVFAAAWVYLPQTDLGSANEAEQSQGEFPAVSEEERDNDRYLAEKQITDFASAAKFISALAREKGAVYAFDLMGVIKVPPGIDMHLLGHAVGDILYEQQGLDGMKYCTPAFRNACSHTVVIGALLEQGLGVFDEVNRVCQEAPGGLGAYTMCFHGFGHGVLAYSEYEFPDAVELCRKTGTDEYNNQEFHQCIGGMVMEMHDGIHDPETWEPMRDKYLDLNDPLRLCEREYMPEDGHYFCYTYITPYMFDAAAGRYQANPKPDIFEKAMSYCAAVADERNKYTCYAGFGKEFIVLVQGRDIRNIDSTSDEKMQIVIDWCNLAPEEIGIEACLLSVQDSLYWGGENSYQASIRYCSLMSEQSSQDLCFEHMGKNVAYYEKNPDTLEEICLAVPERYQKRCKEVLLNQ